MFQYLKQNVHIAKQKKPSRKKIAVAAMCVNFSNNGLSDGETGVSREGSGIWCVTAQFALDAITDPMLLPIRNVIKHIINGYRVPVTALTRETVYAIISTLLRKIEDNK